MVSYLTHQVEAAEQFRSAALRAKNEAIEEGDVVSDFPWGPVLAALAGGGLAGSILTAVVTARRNRVQPVGYQLELKQLFGEMTTGAAKVVKFTFTEGATKHEFSNLYQLRLEITNKGNADIKEFEFSVSLPVGTKIIFVEAEDPDRSHKFATKPTVSPAAPVHVLDFKLCPFNRGNGYEVFAYLTDAGELDAEDVQLTSPASVAFTSSPTAMELMAKSAATMSIDLGFYKLSIGPK